MQIFTLFTHTLMRTVLSCCCCLRFGCSRAHRYHRMSKTWPKPVPFSNQKAAPYDDDTPSSSPPVELTTNWFSIYVAAALSFVGTVQFSLYFSSIWPYLQIIDRSINETQFGWVIAIYSVGQIISAPLFGYLSNKIRQVRLPLIIGLVLMFIGNVSYLSLEMLNFPKLYILLFCRLITGMGSGNVCLLRTYASTASTAKDRSRAIAFVTCGQALGATGGPAFQLIFTFIAYPGFKLFGFTSLRFNLYTAPAYLACLMNITGAIVLIGCFTEYYAGLGEVAGKLDNEEANGKMPNGEKKAGAIVMDEPKLKLPPYDWIACMVCFLSRFTQMFVQGNLETIGSPYAMMMFAWAEQKAVEVTSIAQSLVGGITFATYIIYIGLKSNKEPNYRLSCILSFVGLIAFHLITFAWPFLPTTVTMFNETQNLSIAERPVGCNLTKFSWCQHLSQVNVWLYYCSYVICIGLAFPILNIAMNTLFSHILGPRRQGTQQGFFQISGTIARLLGPILMSTLYTLYGPNMAWIMELVVSGLTLSLWMLFYGRMVPLLESKRNRKVKRRTLSNVTSCTRLEEGGGAEPAKTVTNGTILLANGANLNSNTNSSSSSRRHNFANTLAVVYEREGKLSVSH